MTDEHIIEEVWEALKHRCCATKPTDPEKWEEVSRIVMFSKDDLRAALAAAELLELLVEEGNLRHEVMRWRRHHGLQPQRLAP